MSRWIIIPAAALAVMAFVACGDDTEPPISADKGTTTGDGSSPWPDVGGTYYAADLHCPHLHADLSKGTLDGTILTCPLHHSQFDLRDGGNLAWTDWKGTAKSMAEFVRHPRPLRVYETHVEDGSVCIGPQKEPPSDA
jgi:3-phenylpropionate/trans-cinnamate dioxygenase ferredoxin subunit